ncbi:hydrophobic protein [Lactobacillus hamsteri]|uniref:Hydrophobic protein n=1 Tax=Lactobacillus hamsteri DSM 5661 = JCM 6256 TaxID=1423754 RepID=A0A0R1YM24_9LACO|nr:hypothetical protein [Lactobacillus hamsteri]KRM40268.1 hydrophobic protein [Lactobacillus hamsteri DSM 5661 = JCM 6256]
MGLWIFLLILIYFFVKETFEEETATRVSLVIIPIYSALMMIFTIGQNFTPQTLLITLGLIIVGITVGLFQTKKVQVTVTDELNKYQLPKVKIKRGWYYLIGWIAIFVISILVEMAYGAEINHEELSEKLAIEILRDMSSIVMFTNESSWFIWVLNFSSSWTYDTYLFFKYPKLRQYVVLRKKN